MAYLCECKPRPGTLSAAKCFQLGVPKGPLLGKLKNGESITLDNGTVIHADDVLEPSEPGPIFLVIDIPSIGYLRSLQQNDRFNEYLKSNLDDVTRSDLILHFTPATVMDSLEYKEFSESFSTNTKHLALNERNRLVDFYFSSNLSLS